MATRYWYRLLESASRPAPEYFSEPVETLIILTLAFGNGRSGHYQRGLFTGAISSMSKSPNSLESQKALESLENALNTEKTPPPKETFSEADTLT